MHITRTLLAVSLVTLCLFSNVAFGQGGLIYPTVILPQISETPNQQIKPRDREQPSSTVARFVNDDYLIGSQDLINIEVFQVEELSRTVRVSSRGRISLPLIGTINAKGLTAVELEQAITTKLAEEYLQEPYVSVFIEEYTSQRVTIEGEVYKSGIYALTGKVTLLQTVAMAEGMRPLANLKRVQVFRISAEGAKEILFFNIDAIRKGNEEDPVMQGDDIIVVHKAAIRSALKGITDSLRGIFVFGKTL